MTQQGNTFTSDLPRDHLIIPDRQAYHGSGNSVDFAIGNYIVKHRPDVIINIGDHADMPSLSSYDVGKKSFEGRTYKKDIDASIRAHEAMWRPMDDYNQKMRDTHHSLYKPLKVITVGNHENRINRAVENDSKLDGLISLDDLQYSRWYDYVSPFMEPVIVDGVCYVHYAFKKSPQFPIAGKHQARGILDAYMMSVTVGHTPEFHYAEAYRGDNKRIQCIVAGACFDHDEPYAGERNKRYWRGIVHKRNVRDGNYNFEMIGLDTLLKEYS